MLKLDSCIWLIWVQNIQQEWEEGGRHITGSLLFLSTIPLWTPMDVVILEILIQHHLHSNYTIFDRWYFIKGQIIYRNCRWSGKCLCMYAYNSYLCVDEYEAAASCRDHEKTLQNGLCLFVLRGEEISFDSVLFSISHITCTSSYPQVSTSLWSFKSPAPARAKQEHNTAVKFKPTFQRQIYRVLLVFFKIFELGWLISSLKIDTTCNESAPTKFGDLNWSSLSFNFA